jgi:uncharacterized protein
VRRRGYQRLGLLGLSCLVLLAPISAISSQVSIATTFNDPAEWVPKAFSERVAWEEFSEEFEVGETVLLSWPGATLENSSLQKVADAIVAAEGDRVRSSNSGPGIFDSLINAPANLPKTTAANRLRGSLVGFDSQQSLVIVTLSDAGRRDRVDLVPRLRRIAAEVAGVKLDDIKAIGIPVEGAVIDGSVTESVRQFALPSSLIAIVICWLCLRSWWLTLAISSVAMIGQGLALGAVLLTGLPMNAILIVLPPLVFVLTISSGIHLSNYFLEALHLPADLAEEEALLSSDEVAERAVGRALRAGFPPCLLASGTTIVGLLSLSIVQIVPVRHFGLIAATALAGTLVLLLMVLPATMLLYGKKFAGCPNGISRPRSICLRMADRFYRIPTRYPLAVAGAVLGFMAVFGYGLRNTRTSVSLTSLFAADHPMRQDFNWFEKTIGPSVTGELVIRFDTVEASEPLDRLALVNKIHAALYNRDDVSGVLSPGVFLPPIPSSRGIASRVKRTLLSSQIKKTDSDSVLVSSGYLAHRGQAEFWRVSYRIPAQGGIHYDTQLLEIAQMVEALVEKEALSPTVTSTGGVMLIEAAQNNLLRGLLNSFVAAFVTVAIVMMILLRSVIGGCLAMIPNFMPTLVTFGFMGLANTPLDIGAVMTASLALGIAVDDTVHLLSRFASFRNRGQDPAAATLLALQQCGPAMLQTTLVCGVSLLVYGLSDFLPTRRFAVLMLCLLSTAIVGDLLLLPAILSGRFATYFARPTMGQADLLPDVSEGSSNQTR